jgi:hypothetical protein
MLHRSLKKEIICVFWNSGLKMERAFLLFSVKKKRGKFVGQEEKRE